MASSLYIWARIQTQSVLPKLPKCQSPILLVTHLLQVCQSLLNIFTNLWWPYLVYHHKGHSSRCSFLHVLDTLVSWLLGGIVDIVPWSDSYFDCMRCNHELKRLTKRGTIVALMVSHCYPTLIIDRLLCWEWFAVYRIEIFSSYGSQIVFKPFRHAGSVSWCIPSMLLPTCGRNYAFYHSESNFTGL